MGVSMGLGSAKSTSGYFTGTFTGQKGELQKLLQSGITHGGNTSCCNSS